MPTLPAALEPIQKELFALGARLADPSSRIAARVTKAAITDADIERLEQLIDRARGRTAAAAPRSSCPAARRAGALLHLARTVCRRAERRVVALGPGAVDPILDRLPNRLSDLLFVMARAVNHRAGVPEIEW